MKYDKSNVKILKLAAILLFFFLQIKHIFTTWIFSDF